jgi:hypothetical protein
MMSLFQFVEENDALSQVLLTADHYRIPTFSPSPNLANSLTIMETLWEDLSRFYFILAVISSDLIKIDDWDVSVCVLRLDVETRIASECKGFRIGITQKNGITLVATWGKSACRV